MRNQGSASLDNVPWLTRIAILVRRERKTRFSGGRLGALWAFITPVTWVAFVLLFYQYTGRTPPVDTGLEIFVAVGFLPYIIFRQTITSMTRGSISNRSLLVLRGVKVGDLLTASAVQELINSLILMVVIFGGITLIFGSSPPADILKSIEGIVCAWLLGMGLGRLLAVWSLMSDTALRMIPIVLRPTFWISGIFYTARELPGPIYDVLAWSPLLHMTEILREGYFLGYYSPLSNGMFVLICGLVPYVLSFFFEGYLVRNNASRYRI